MAEGKQVALITGASKGLGEATAKALAKAGYNLVLSARSEAKLKALQEQLSTAYPDLTIRVMPCDVRSATACECLIQQVNDEFGRLDVLINNAGVGGRVGLMTEVPTDQIEDMLDTNLKAPIILSKAALAVMVPQESGTIININSIAGKTAFPYWAVYDATKFGLRALTEALAQEQRSNGIRIIGIYPGAAATEIWDATEIDNVSDKSGMLEPERVAEAVLFALQQPGGTFISELTIEPLKPAL